jgi:hypothetical protein
MIARGQSRNFNEAMLRDGQLAEGSLRPIALDCEQG